jgi:hypothetical protein
MNAKLGLSSAVLSLCLALSAHAMDAKVAMEEFMVPAADPGISLYVRNKHPEGVNRFAADKILLYVQYAYKRYVEIGEGTHTVIMEKNRMQLFQAVQQFLDEDLAAAQ